MTTLSSTLKHASYFSSAYTFCEKNAKTMVMHFQGPLVYLHSALIIRLHNVFFKVFFQHSTHVNLQQ